MKKLFILLSMVSFAIVAKAQQSVVFKYKYKPKHTYDLSNKTVMDMQMTMTADSATMKKMAASGMKQPMLMKISVESNASIKTAEATSPNAIPFSIIYSRLVSKATLNGIETPTPADNNPLVGLTVNGTIDADSKMHIDTGANGTTGPDMMKSVIAKMINQMSAKIKFPEKPMMIGDSFTQEVPMSVPVSGLNMNFGMKIVYKLISIKDNLGYFDTMSDFDMDINLEANGQKVSGKGNGGGPGKIVYDIAKDFSQSATSNIDMTFNMNIGPMKMGMKINGNTDLQYVISAN